MQHCHSLLHAALIVTQDDERRIFENASLAIDQGLVLAVGPRSELAAAFQPERELDLGNMLVLPGLVNAHTHTAMTFLRGLADDMPLMQWLTQRIFPVEQHLTPEIVRLSSLLGFAEMLRTGTTACVDMYIFEEAVFEAAATAGLRCLGGEVVFDFPSASCAGPEETLERTRALAKSYQGNDRLRVAVNPHSVYTASPKTLTACRDLAQELNLPLHIHLAENCEETSICQERYGKRPVAHCHDLGLLTHPITAAHLVDLTPDEIDILAACKVTAAHNAASNMKLGSGVSAVPAMLSKGIIVALGTDGPASNNCLNMFMEMNRAALLQKVHAHDPTLMPAAQVLDAATRGGAAAMHDARLGRLAPGSVADLAALDLDAPNFQPMYNPIAHAVYAATGMEVRMTMVGGDILYQDGHYTGFDYADLCREARELRRFVLRSLGLAENTPAGALDRECH